MGAPKTGTSLLQQHVFSKWPNMEYINTLWFPQLVLTNQSKKYLISNETLFGKAYSRDPSKEVDWYGERKLVIQGLSRLFPDAQILVSFRKHVDFILSVYKQFLHEGGAAKLSRWFDIDNNTGMVKKQELLYMRTIELLEESFGKKPFVFTLEEVKNDFQGLLQKFERLFGEKKPDIDLNGITPLNVGVRYWQGKLLRLLNTIDKRPYTRFTPKGFLRLTTEFTTKHRIDPRHICQHRLKDFSKKPIRFEKLCERKIEEYYRSDWHAVNDYIRDFDF
jgi:hypothetical protein